MCSSGCQKAHLGGIVELQRVVRASSVICVAVVSCFDRGDVRLPVVLKQPLVMEVSLCQRGELFSALELRTADVEVSREPMTATVAAALMRQMPLMAATVSAAGWPFTSADFRARPAQCRP